MSRRRFLVDPGALTGELVALPPAEADHARKVLRLAAGAEVELLDGQGVVARAFIEDLQPEGLLCRITQRQRPPLPRPRLVLCPGVLKGPAMDALAVKLSELMVDQVRPFFSRRSATNPRRTAARLARWQRLARQALKQCGAPRPPRFAEPAALSRVLAAAPAQALKLLLLPDQEGPTISQALAQGQGKEEIWALVGPEGGFSSQEAAQARAAGFAACRLPGAVLRAETASLALACLVRLGPWAGEPQGP